MYWVGVDVGGTFTDLVVYNSSDQSLSLGKSPSTPDDPGRGVLNALRNASIDLSAVERFRHGAQTQLGLVHRIGCDSAVSKPRKMPFHVGLP